MHNIYPCLYVGLDFVLAASIFQVVAPDAAATVLFPFMFVLLQLAFGFSAVLLKQVILNITVSQFLLYKIHMHQYLSELEKDEETC